MRRITIIIIIILALSPQIILRSQNLTDLEKKYNDLQTSYVNEKSILDSLQKKLNLRVKEINLEKSRKAPDYEKIASLMSNSVNLSNNVDENQKKLGKMGKEIEKVKKELNEKYTDVIDSLKVNQKKGTANKDVTENLILFYAAKRLEVIPGINLLSFNPDKIMELDLKKTRNTADKKIFLEYLENALNEVNGMLTNVTAESNEINQVIELQKKTSKFLEETELESGVASGKISQTGAQTYSGPESGLDYSGITNREAKANLSNNVQVYEHLLNQLNTIKSFSESYDGLHYLSKDIDLFTYGRLLRDVKKGLSEYKKLLEQKIDSFQ
jgi:chromosome segregation ATPase